MTLSDLDLETRLRDQRTRIDEIPPTPGDLVLRVRERAREQRRRRVALSAAGIAAALVFVGLPVLTSGLLGNGSDGESAAPPSRRPSPNDVPSLSELPTRGSLADDEEWLAGVAELSWQPAADSGVPPEVLSTLPDPAADTRHVAFVGDVPGGRAALVFGRDQHEGVVHAWFVGPEDADAAELSLAVLPGMSPERVPMALWTMPDPASTDEVIVVVGHPGDEAEVLTGREVTADGQIQELWQTVPMEDGSGAVSPEHPFSWPFGVEFEIHREGQTQPMFPTLDFGDDVFLGSREPLAVADPRGLAATVDEVNLQWTAEALMAHYGLPPSRLGPTLLAAGPVGADSTTTVVLVGVTFPSGATATHLMTYWGGPENMSSMSVMRDPVPAGTALLDQTLAIATTNALTVSAPSSGAVAEAYRTDGTLLAAVPLVDGVGIAPLALPTADLETVRVLDARGALVAEVPVERG